MNEKIQEYEELLKKHGAIRATIKYYKINIKQIVVGLFSVGIIGLLIYAQLPLWLHITAVLAILTINFIYGKVIK